QPNSSSNAITSSTVSRLSAPRSSMKLAFSVTFSASTPRCSTTIFFTRSPMSLIACNLVSFELGSIGQRPRAIAVWVSSGVGSSGRERPPCDDGPRKPAPAKPKSGYHTSNALTSAPEPQPEPLLGPQRRSNHCHSAVHVQRLAGDVAGLVRGQKYRRCGHVGA